MDAATPFRRWLRTAGLLALLTGGCKTTHSLSDRDGEVPAPRPAGDPAYPVDPQDAADRQKDITDWRTKSAADYVGYGGKARPQAPTGPVAGSPVTPAAPVAGSPVGPAPVTPASLSRPADAAKSARPEGESRVKVVAIVGAGNIITDQEVWQAVRQRASEYLSIVEGPGGSKQVVRSEEKEKAAYTEQFRNVIERELILDEMYTKLKKAGKPNVIEEIKEYAGKGADTQLRNWKKAQQLNSEDEFRLMLASQGMTAAVIRRQLERQLMADEYVRSMMKEKGKSVGLGDIRAYYDAHPDEFRTEDRVKWQHVFVSFNQFPTKRAAYDQALAVQQQAAGGGDFVALARSLEPPGSARQGFDGIGTKRGEVRPADVEPAVWALAAGQVSGLVEGPTGYHIVKVTERQVAGVKPFDEKVQGEVRRKLMEKMHVQEHKKLVEDLWRRGVVKIIETP